MPLDKELVEKFDSILKRLDETDKRIEAITPPKPEETDKTDDDPDKTEAVRIFKAILKNRLPQEKLDSMSLHDLMLAHDLRATMKPAGGVELEAQSTDKTDSKAESRKPWLVPTVGEDKT